MINYQIVKIDKVLSYVQISYAQEGYETYWVQKALPDPFNDEVLHAMAVEYVVEAQKYWDERAADTPYEMATTTGSIKPVILNPEPAYNTTFEKLSFTWDESGDVREKVWSVDEHSVLRKAHNIRLKRDLLLKETDTEALSDRSLSEEHISYRQALRDITNQETFPNSVIWPIRPIG